MASKSRKFMAVLRRILLVVGATLSALALVATLIYVLRDQERWGKARLIIPRDTQVEIIRPHSETAMLDREDIIKILPIKMRDTIMVPINTMEVESLILDHTPYITSVNAYVAPASRTLNISVSERYPVLRIVSNGASYYLDDQGIAFENRAGAAAHVPIVTTSLSIKEASETLFALALFLKENPTITHFVASIHLTHEKSLQLYPRVGDYCFVLDNTEELAEKLAKIPLFYKRILPQVGIEKYREINLSYRNQIVCKLRHYAPQA